MTKDHERERPKRTPAAPLPARSAAPEHPLLTLQRQAGNRAVATMLQRAGPAGATATAAAPTDLVQMAMSQLPSLSDAVADRMPNPSQVEQGQREASSAQSELAPLGLADNGPLAAWFQSESGAAAPPASVREDVAELSAARHDTEVPTPSKPAPVAEPPGRWARAKAAVSSGLSSVGGAFASAGRAIKGYFNREKRHDLGASAQATAGLASPIAGHANDILGATAQTVDNPATEGAANFFSGDLFTGGHDAVDKVRGAGATVGGVAEGAGKGALEILHTVSSVAGIFFSALKAAVDGRSLLSSINVVRALRRARAEARASGAPAEIVEAVDYAVRQKYEKIIKKAIGTITALAALGVGLAVLIANPVGASIAGLVLGGIGVAVFLYKIGRWAWKKWGSESLGKKREEMAKRLYEAVTGASPNPLALEAVRSLHLEPDEVRRAKDGPALIARKLKSA